MLKERILTALIIAPILIAAILLLPSSCLNFFFASLILLAAWEWSKLSGVKTIFLRWVFLSVMALILFMFDYGYEEYHDIFHTAVVAWWFILAGIVITFNHQSKNYNRYISLSLLVGLVTLGLAWLCLVRLHALGENGPYYVLYVCCLVAAADVGAYFVGRRFGRKLLAANLSPGKTREGAVGGLLAVLILAFVVIGCFGFVENDGAFILLSLFVALFSIIGDLFESLIKRVAGVKDSGSLLPGHGGVLDRVDSALAAIPIFFVGSLWFL